MTKNEKRKKEKRPLPKWVVYSLTILIPLVIIGALITGIFFLAKVISWHWLLFFAILLVIPCGIISLIKWCKKLRNCTDEENRNAVINGVKYTLFYWLCDLFYMTFIIDNIIWRFIFGGLVMLIIFYNLALTVANGKITFKWGTLQDFIIGLGLTVYLIYLIPNATLQTIVLSVVAAAFGGLLTLIGVAWTIKSGDKNRREDQERFEEEKRKEEIRKAKPIFSFCAHFGTPHINNGEKICLSEENAIVKDDTYYLYPYECCAYIENSNHSVFEAKRIYHDERWNELVGNTVFLPNQKSLIDFKFCSYESIVLEVVDELDNNYYYRIKVLIDVTSANGKLYTIQSIKEISVEKVNL